MTGTWRAVSAPRQLAPHVRRQMGSAACLCWTARENTAREGIARENAALSCTIHSGVPVVSGTFRALLAALCTTGAQTSSPTPPPPPPPGDRSLTTNKHDPPPPHPTPYDQQTWPPLPWTQAAEWFSVVWRDLLSSLQTSFPPVGKIQEKPTVALHIRHRTNISKLNLGQNSKIIRLIGKWRELQKYSKRERSRDSGSQSSG